MAITGYEKPLKDYTKEQLIEIAESYSIYYTTKSGKGKIGGYSRLTKDQLISIIKNDRDYQRSNPKNPRTPGGNQTFNRFKNFKESLIGTETPQELMNEILSKLEETQRPYPIAGRYYTYIYYAATPKIIYDQHPLIKAGDLLSTGFRGFNYHLRRIRQYNTVDGDRLISGLYEINEQEFATLRTIPYAKIVQN